MNLEDHRKETQEDTVCGTHHRIRHQGNIDEMRNSPEPRNQYQEIST